MQRRKYTVFLNAKYNKIPLTNYNKPMHKKDQAVHIINQLRAT